ncbi:MAG: hypothetical protein IT181_27800 [Acidobacteria bacterium]|nr:hypothetical protein [Acidobacteriota bacterium]
MNSLPLHPAVVHLPLGLAMLMPLIAAGFAWALWTGRLGTRAWFAVVALQALLLGSGFLAMNSGGAEEERVEAVVQESALEQHEERAELFMWAAGVTLALTGLVVVLPLAAAVKPLAAAATVATLVVAVLALNVGHAGGQLVYVHGAASAYTQAATAGGSAATPAHGAVRRGDDDDDRR